MRESECGEKRIEEGFESEGRELRRGWIMTVIAPWL